MTADLNADNSRAIAIDRLRTAMMCVVMFGHAMLPYITTPRRFNDPSSSAWFDWVGIFLYGFAMPAFFVTAGFAGAALLANKGASRFWQHRWRRLGIPLLFGYMLLTPLTRAAYEFAQIASAETSLLAGWQQVVQLGWLRWSKLYHLWFLASLILFSALLFAVSRALNNRQAWVHRSDAAFARLLGSGAGSVALGLLTGAPMALSYISGTGQGTDQWMQLALVLYFALGWWLFGHREVLQRQISLWPMSAIGALVIAPLCAWSTRTRLLAEDVIDVPVGMIAGLSNGLLGAFATLALLGIAQRWFEHESDVADYLSRASYWIYLVHYPIVVAAGGIVSVIDTGPLQKYLLAVSIAVPIIFATFECSRRLQGRPKTA